MTLVRAEARTAVVAVSDAEPARRYGRALWRLAFAGGLLLASWVLATILSATASADELPRTASNGAPSSGEIGRTPGAKAEARQTSKPGKAKTPEPRTFVPRRPGISAPDKAPARGASPAQPWLSTPSKAAPAAAPPSKPVVPEKTTTGHPAGDAKPLGALVGSLATTVNTVTGTVGSLATTVTGTVGGLVGTVSDTVLQPVTGGNAEDAPGPLPLPIIGGLLPGLGLPDDGNSPSGGTVTIAVPATLPAEATTPVGSQPGAPQPALQAGGAPTAVNRVPTKFTAAGLRAAHRHSAVDKSARSDKHLGSPPGGGSSGGGNLPVTPCAPIALASITAGHDGSGGARQQHAVLGSSANNTQLQLIGTSLDHEVDGAGRDATLPTTSPD
jgi:hypothetical protein